MQRKKELLIVARGILTRLDHQKAVLSAVLRSSEVVHRHGVGVIPAKAGRAGREGVAGARAHLDGGRPFFDGAVRLGGCEEAVQMDHLRPVGVVRHLDGHRLILFKAQQGTGDLAVVGGRLQSVARRQIERDRRDVDPVIGRGQIPAEHAERGSETDEGGKLK